MAQHGVGVTIPRGNLAMPALRPAAWSLFGSLEPSQRMQTRQRHHLLDGGVVNLVYSAAVRPAYVHALGKKQKELRDFVKQRFAGGIGDVWTLHCATPRGDRPEKGKARREDAVRYEGRLRTTPEGVGFQRRMARDAAEAAMFAR
ncbi:hypothetical protein D3C71_1707660 [compost metagenome]